MSEFEYNVTVRAQTALRYLGIETKVDLYLCDIPPAGTVLYPGFRGMFSFTLSKKCREELIALQKEAIREIEKDMAMYIGQMMLDNPENFGLI